MADPHLPKWPSPSSFDALSAPIPLTGQTPRLNNPPARFSTGDADFDLLVHNSPVPRSIADAYVSSDPSAARLGGDYSTISSFGVRAQKAKFPHKSLVSSRLGRSVVTPESRGVERTGSTAVVERTTKSAVAEGTSNGTAVLHYPPRPAEVTRSIPTPPRASPTKPSVSSGLRNIVAVGKGNTVQRAKKIVVTEESSPPVSSPMSRDSSPDEEVMNEALSNFAPSKPDPAPKRALIKPAPKPAPTEAPGKRTRAAVAQLPEAKVPLARATKPPITKPTTTTTKHISTIPRLPAPVEDETSITSPRKSTGTAYYTGQESPDSATYNTVQESPDPQATFTFSHRKLPASRGKTIIASSSPTMLTSKSLVQDSPASPQLQISTRITRSRDRPPTYLPTPSSSIGSVSAAIPTPASRPTPTFKPTKLPKPPPPEIPETPAATTTTTKHQRRATIAAQDEIPETPPPPRQARKKRPTASATPKPVSKTPSAGSKAPKPAAVSKIPSPPVSIPAPPPSDSLPAPKDGYTKDLYAFTPQMLASSGSLWDGESGRRVSGRRHTVVFTAPVETRKRKNIAAVGARKGAAAGEAKKRKVVGGKKDVDVEDVTIKTTRRRSGKVERAVEERTKTSKPRRRSGRGAGTAIPVASGKVYSAEFSDEE